MDNEMVVTANWIRLLSLALVGASLSQAESYSSKQCPSFATTDQPYFYLYSGEQYSGAPLYITNASAADLGSLKIGLVVSSYFDDAASSVRLRGRWQVCTQSSYGGKCTDVASSDWKSELMIPSLAVKFGSDFDDSISSIRLLGCSQY